MQPVIFGRGGMIMVDENLWTILPNSGALSGYRCSPRFAEANFVDGESRAIERVGRRWERKAGRISRNGGQKVRARSEKRVGALGRSGRIAVRENEMFPPRATWTGSRELLASEVHAQVSPSRLFFFFLPFEGKLKAARGKGRYAWRC